MELAQVRAILGEHREELRRRGVASLSVFGSVARGEALHGSDIDLLVRFDTPPGALAFVALRDRLEQLLGRPVDLVTPAGLRPWMRPAVLAEAVRAA